MKRFFYIIIFFSVFLLGCNSSNLINDIYKHTKSKNKKDRQTAFILLSELALDLDIIDKLQKEYSLSKNDYDKLLYTYTLSKRMAVSQEDFIKAYPTDKKLIQEWILDNLESSEYVSLMSPFYDYLCDLALDNDLALEKLIITQFTIFEFDCRSVGEVLVKIYKDKPDRILKILKKLNLKLNSFFEALGEYNPNINAEKWNQEIENFIKEAKGFSK